MYCNRVSSEAQHIVSSAYCKLRILHTLKFSTNGLSTKSVFYVDLASFATEKAGAKRKRIEEARKDSLNTVSYNILSS